MFIYNTRIINRVNDMIQCIIVLYYLLCVYGKIIATKDLTQQDRAKLFRIYNIYPEICYF